MRRSVSLGKYVYVYAKIDVALLQVKPRACQFVSEPPRIRNYFALSVITGPAEDESGRIHGFSMASPSNIFAAEWHAIVAPAMVLQQHVLTTLQSINQELQKQRAFSEGFNDSLGRHFQVTSDACAKIEEQQRITRGSVELLREDFNLLEMSCRKIGAAEPATQSVQKGRWAYRKDGAAEPAGVDIAKGGSPAAA
jgi:hypothetical protein